MTRSRSAVFLLVVFFSLCFAGSSAGLGQANQGQVDQGQTGRSQAGQGQPNQDPAGQSQAERLKAFTEAQRAKQAEQAESSEEAPPTNFEGPQLPSGQTLGALERLENLSPDAAASYLAALKAQFDYKTVGFKHRERVFAWQYYSSILIFAMVVLLVSAGFYFSWVQFKRDMEGPAEAAQTELELSAQGVKIQSSILGVIILVVSLAFLYLYLVYVYPISEIL